VVLRCTRRACDLLRVQPAPDIPPGEDDWYLNVLWIDRRKCLLFLHATTLFPVFVADVRAAEVWPIGAFTVRVLEAALSAEQLPADCLGVLDPGDVRPAKTASRSVLGVMNELAYLSRYQAARAGGLGRTDVSALNRFLRRTPHNRDGYVWPLDLVTARVARQSSPRGG
jgi:uncharacterized protein DUF6933